MMVNKTITLGNGQSVAAEIIGQLGLHDDSDNVAWVMVTHVKSGGLIAAYSDYSDARDFAVKANELLNFDAYTGSIIANGTKDTRKQFGEQLEAVITLRSSYTTYILETLNRREMGRKAIAERMG